MELNQIFRCQVCGNVVELVNVGGGQLVCCGQPMDRLEPNTEDAASEKHVPVIDVGVDKILVKIGSEPHPMDEKHYIQWIELLLGGNVVRIFLQPGNAPQAEFEIKTLEKSKIQYPILARAYCNLHGLWQATKEA